MLDDYLEDQKASSDEESADSTEDEGSESARQHLDSDLEEEV